MCKIFGPQNTIVRRSAPRLGADFLLALFLTSAMLGAAANGADPLRSAFEEPSSGRFAQGPMLLGDTPRAAPLPAVHQAEETPAPAPGALQRTPPTATPYARRMIGGVDAGVRPLFSSRFDIAPKPSGANRELPQDYASEAFAAQPRLADVPRPSAAGRATVAESSASEFCYQPLYFEEVNLERYGRTREWMQPAISGARFFATVPALPYLMTVHDPKTCYEWRHPYEAGRSAPHERELPPFDLRAAAVQVGVMSGVIFLFP